VNSHPLDNAGWHALNSHHSYLAEVTGVARRYPADVSPFGAVDAVTDEAWNDLAAAAGAGHPVVLFRVDAPDPPDGWTLAFRGHGHQMVAGDLVDLEPVAIDQLTVENVPEMMALVRVAQPGPFLARTIEMGNYYGVFDDGRLVAMAGERMHLDGFTEISAVCTHPDARGRGLAAALTRHVSLGIRGRGEEAFLHVASDNHNARRVYERLGFVRRAGVDFMAAQPPA
jgi:ribosomal protein S18 acetylase RimI-like enzyme